QGFTKGSVSRKTRIRIFSYLLSFCTITSRERQLLFCSNEGALPSFRSTAIRERGGNGSNRSILRKIGVRMFSIRICASPKVFLRKICPLSHHAGEPGRLNLMIPSTRKPACL